MVAVNPSATLAFSSFVPADMTEMLSLLGKEVPSALQAALGSWGLMDHVGSVFYTPWTFAQEVSQIGASRRVPRSLALALIDRLPCPILFTHSDIAFFATEQDRDRWYSERGRGGISHPTWQLSSFGYPDKGVTTRHMFVHDKAILDWGLKEEDIARWGIQYHEAVFGFSMITEASYVLKEGETGDSDLARELFEQGFVIRQLED
jgi:hypothetical protein